MESRSRKGKVEVVIMRKKGKYIKMKLQKEYLKF